MKYPGLSKLQRRQGTIDRFYGYEHLETVRNGAFYDMENLSSDKFPLLSVREKRSVFKRERDGAEIPLSFDAPVTHALALSAGIAVATENSVYFRGERLVQPVLSPGEKNRRIIPFGRNFFISPDCVYVEVDDDGSVNVTHIAGEHSCADANFYYVYEDYSYFEVRRFVLSDEPPIDDEVKDWIDTSTGRFIHKHLTGGKWETQAEFYVLLEWEGIGSGLSANDKILVRGFNDREDTYTVVRAEEDKLLLTGTLAMYRDLTPEVTIRKISPVMDFVVEHQNRLWGCRYGKNAAGDFVNEIYASALGDPTRWFTFKGVSTDSYTASLGCAGAFTGAAVIGRDLIFFKESYLIRVSGSNPGDYYVSVTPARGIKRGAEDSAVTLNEKIFYLSSGGVTVYDGALPYVISEEFRTAGFSGARAAAGNGKYYLAAYDGEKPRIFVYDTSTGLWHVEDDPGVKAFALFGSSLLFLAEKDAQNFVYDVLCAGECPEERNIFGEAETGLSFSFAPEADVSWFAETGFLGGESGSYICRNVILRLQMEEGAAFTLEIKAQRDKKWTGLCRIRQGRTGTFSVPLNTPRSPGFYFRLSGTGGLTLHSLSLISEKTGEVNFYGK